MLVRLTRVVALGATVASGLAACGSSSAPTPTARPSATPDANAPAVRDVATKFIQAQVKSEETGDARPVEQYVVPGSQANGDAGALADITIEQKIGIVTTKRACVDWRVNASSTSATVHVTCTFVGHQVSIANGRSISGDIKGEPITWDMKLIRTAGQEWLLSESHAS